MVVRGAILFLQVRIVRRQRAHRQPKNYCTVLVTTVRYRSKQTDVVEKDWILFMFQSLVQYCRSECASTVSFGVWDGPTAHQAVGTYVRTVVSTIKKCHAKEKEHKHTPKSG